MTNLDEFQSLGYWIRRRRKALDLTQTELAGLVFCSLSTIKKIELDERRPSPLMAERLAISLQIEDRDRHNFLAVASAELAIDRFKPTYAISSSKPVHSNLSSYLPTTPFVGYKKELADISSLISQQEYRLISLVGPGGIGKTRLAIQAALDSAHNFSGGAFFIPLAQLASPEYIPSAILEALSLPRHGATVEKAFLMDRLRDRAVLLILDNLEHLLEGAAFIADIIHSDPSVVILVTSRVPLNLSIEWVFEVKGMPIIQPAGMADVQASDAVQLFLQTARRVGSEVEINQETLSTIMRICAMVGGIPLAIVLAASWARSRSYHEIEMGIKADMDFLTSKMTDVPERHRSMRAAFEYSWRFLSEAEKHLFPVLSIFRGGFDVPAVHTIASTNQATLELLVDQSLLRRMDADRYDMHELLRRYSELKLVERGEVMQYRKAHLSYYLELAERSVTYSILDPIKQSLPLARDIDNFRAALDSAIEFRDPEQSLRLAIALGPFWRGNAYLLEGASWLRKVLELENGQFPSLRAKALIQSARIALEEGNDEQAVLFSKEGLSISKVHKDKPGIGLSLLINGTAYYLNGEFERGIKVLNKCLRTFEELGDDQNLAYTLLRLADANMRFGRLDIAGGLWERAFSISRKLNSRYEMGFSLGGLGDIRRRQGKYHEAVQFHRQSLQIHWEDSYRLDIPYLLEALGLDYAAIGSMDQAAILLGAAEQLRNEIHAPLPPSYQNSYSPVIKELQQQLGESQYLRFWQEGQSASLDQLIREVIHLGRTVG